MIDAARQTHPRGRILQLYGTGNLPSLKDDLIQCLAEATAAGVVAAATTQCPTGSVIMGHYSTGQKLLGAGMVSASDVTIKATTIKLAYFVRRRDLRIDEVRDLMAVDLRGEMTPESELPPPPLGRWRARIRRRSRRRIGAGSIERGVDFEPVCILKTLGKPPEVISCDMGSAIEPCNGYNAWVAGNVSI
mmetsp:Transcript_30660/g.65157  ORF Transcript_30660/g.65157 Transcript_30660/m.65157 type:complete len:190 (-) Transcript_30660:93-662(-)